MQDLKDVNKEEIVDRISFRAKTRRGNLILKKRNGEHVEGSKCCLFITSNNSSEELKKFMLELHLLQKPYSVYKPKKHPQLANILENLPILVKYCVNNLCSFFFSIIPNKKYPSRFLLGRLFCNQLFDYYVFSLISFIPQSSFPLSKEVAYDTKPIVLCQGSYFDKDETTKYLKNVLLDFFKHKNVDSFSKNSLQRLIVLTAYETKTSKQIISFRQYLIQSTFFDTPEIMDLQEVGPRFDFSLLKCKTPDYEEMQEALKTSAINKKPKKSNKVEKDSFGNLTRKLYIQKPDFKTLHTKHNKFNRIIRKNMDQEENEEIKKSEEIEISEEKEISKEKEEMDAE